MMERLTYDLTRGEYVDDPYVSDEYVQYTVRAGLQLAMSMGGKPVDFSDQARIGKMRAMTAEEVLEDIRRRINAELGDERPNWERIVSHALSGLVTAYDCETRDLRRVGREADDELAALRERLASIERVLYPERCADVGEPVRNANINTEQTLLERGYLACTCSVLHEGEDRPMTPISDCPVHANQGLRRESERRHFAGHDPGLAPDDPNASGYSPHPFA